MPVQFATLLIVSAEPPTDTRPAIAVVSDGASAIAVATAPTLDEVIRTALQTAADTLTPRIAGQPLDRAPAEVVANVLATLDATPTKETA